MLNKVLQVASKVRYPVILTAIVFVLNSIFLRLHTLILDRNLAYTGDDFTFEVFITKLASEGNFLGISTNVGWPDGFAVWSNPAYGFGPYYASLLLSLIFGSLNVYQLYFLVLAVGLSINSFAGYWMAAREFSNKIYPLLIGLLIGLSPFGLLRIGHMPVAWFYFPIIVIGVAFRLNRGQIQKFNAFLILAIGGIFSPLWWTIATLLIAFFVFLTTLFKKQSFLHDFINWGLILTGIITSILPTFSLMVVSRDYSGEGSRFPWQSDVFGGRFLDLVLSSPFLNSRFDLIEKLQEGISPEARTSFIGLVLGASVIILFIYLLNDQNYSIDVPSDFKKLSLIILLFFTVGGLGNLQAGFFVLFDQVSPARVWFRLGIVLGILGLFIVLKFLDSVNLSNSKIVFISIILVMLSLLDLNSITKREFIKTPDLIEYAPTKFLETKTKDCPVLQIPIDTYPLMQDFLGQNGDKFIYPQMIPYTLSSNNKWSLVATPNNVYWKNYREMPSEVNSENVMILKQNGFCAILFDKDFSTWQIERNAGLDFTPGVWPGLRVNLPKIDFENDRYQVYLLENK